MIIQRKNGTGCYAPYLRGYISTNTVDTFIRKKNRSNVKYAAKVSVSNARWPYIRRSITKSHRTNINATFAVKLSITVPHGFALYLSPPCASVYKAADVDTRAVEELTTVLWGMVSLACAYMKSVGEPYQS